MTERVEEIRALYARGDWWLAFQQALAALAQAERETVELRDKAEQVIDARDVQIGTLMQEVGRLKDELMDAQNTADNVRKQWDRERAVDQAALARVRALAQGAADSFDRLAKMDDAVVIAASAVVAAEVIRAALEGRG